MSDTHAVLSVSRAGQQGLSPGYGGFNLVVGDLAADQVAYWSNRGQAAPQVLPPGAYGEGAALYGAG
jgi:hypothetical protein